MSGDERPPSSENMRTGICGETHGKWDNGIYLSGILNDLEIDFLVDSGSNSTLISFETYRTLDETSKPALQTTNTVLMGVNKDELTVHGLANFMVTFTDIGYHLPAIVCDIAPAAILGQDFLIKHSYKLDYKRLQITIGNSTMSC